MRQGLAVGRQRNAIAIAARFGGVQPGLQAGARRTANRLTSDGIVDVRTGASQTVKVRRQVKRVAMYAGGVPALLIGEEDDDVGAIVHIKTTERR